MLKESVFLIPVMYSNFLEKLYIYPTMGVAKTLEVIFSESNFTCEILEGILSSIGNSFDVLEKFPSEKYED